MANSNQRRHRLRVRCDGAPRTARIELDGEQLTFVQRVELVLDAQTGESSARLIIPGAMLDLDAEAEAFIAAHPGPEPSRGRR